MTYLTKQEVADELRVSLKTITQYINEGRLVATKPAGKVLVHRDDLEAFIDAGRIIAGPVGAPGRMR